MVDVNKKILFVSMSDMANGAENVLFMAARASGSPVVFLKKVSKGGLYIPAGQDAQYVTDKSMLKGFWGLTGSLKPYREGAVIMSTHPYLNAYLGFLKRIGYLRSQLIVRECTSVFTRYSGPKKWTYQFAYYLGYPAADLIICQTSLMRNQFLENTSYLMPEKVIVQENPVDLEQILEKSEAHIDGPDAEADFICAAGRLIPEKGFSILISAFKCIKDEYPDLKLLIFGDGPEKDALSRLIESYGLSNRVMLKGQTENPMPYFKRARVCVVSSVKEGFPNVLLEMMALNKVVVSTLCAGGIEAIPDILKAEVNSTKSLVSALKTALCKEYDPQKKSVREYLQNRNPAAFIGAVLKSLQ
jgi:glycosyltransferase involved in cell wall biosynthesis